MNNFCLADWLLFLIGCYLGCCVLGVSTTSDVSSYMVQEYDDDDGKKTFFSLNISGTPANDVGILDREQTLTLLGSCIDRE